MLRDLLYYITAQLVITEFKTLILFLCFRSLRVYYILLVFHQCIFLKFLFYSLFPFYIKKYISYVLQLF